MLIKRKLHLIRLRCLPPLYTPREFFQDRPEPTQYQHPGHAATLISSTLLNCLYALRHSKVLAVFDKLDTILTENILSVYKSLPLHSDIAD